MDTLTNPPRNGEGDQPKAGGGGPANLRAPIKTVKRARALRKDMPLPEVLLWRALRLRPADFKFRRQYPVASYVVDFACLDTRLAIEIDGEAHNRGDQPERDERKDAALITAGFRVLRIPAYEVLRDMNAVIEGIVASCRTVGPLHHQPAAGGPPSRSGEDL